MNSWSKNNYEPCRKEERYEERYEPCKKEEKKCPTIIKCSCPSTVQVLTTAAAPTATTTIASLNLDTSCLCDPKIKLEFATIVATAAAGFAGTVTLRVLKQCRNQFVPVQVGPAWSITIAAASTVPFPFFVCDSDSCFDECCIYRVEATVSAAAGGSGIVTFNNSTLGAIATCEENKCEKKCHEREDRKY